MLGQFLWDGRESAISTIANKVQPKKKKNQKLNQATWPVGSNEFRLQEKCKFLLIM